MQRTSIQRQLMLIRESISRRTSKQCKRMVLMHRIQRCLFSIFATVARGSKAAFKRQRQRSDHQKDPLAKNWHCIFPTVAHEAHALARNHDCWQDGTFGCNCFLCSSCIRSLQMPLRQNRCYNLSTCASLQEFKMKMRHLADNEQFQNGLILLIELGLMVSYTSIDYNVSHISFPTRYMEFAAAILNLGWKPNHC